jgi:hypothetical protein
VQVELGEKLLAQHRQQFNLEALQRDQMSKTAKAEGHGDQGF